MDKVKRERQKFKTDFVKKIRPNDPESLFRDLKTRDQEVKHIWSHQADILRNYNKNHLNTQDIALELPTGTGKTLIGLLLAEYRRQKFDERVVYLCPTRQLAHQVGQHATKYGIPVHILLTPEYKNINEYRISNAVGVTTYSSLFNVNPKINDPQVIILDDAHSSEDYISSLWSVSLSRSRKKELYKEIFELIRSDIEKRFLIDMLDDSGSPDAFLRVDKLPFPHFLKYIDAICDLLDTRLSEDEEWYSWTMIREHLHACCLYLSWHEILLRPIISPTITHLPFANAKQRIYMSATLGEGGELERITGVRKIERIPIPEGWDKQSSGRRLFLFPNMSMDDDDAQEVTIAAIKQAKRALVLTPRIIDVHNIKQRFSMIGIDVLESKDIEETLDAFISKENIALILANRYDGLDLPGDSCRLLIIEGLPIGTNLQERFLYTRLASSSLLRDRLRTRFTQGVGRCCRSSTDYAGILIIGQHAFEFCAKNENRAGMHPELQAELRFGIENSKDVSLEGIIDLLSTFYDQGDEWDEANKEILNLRDKINKVEDTITQTLRKVVSSEVDYVYALWKKDHERALAKAIEVSDTLVGDDVIGYRAWWYYLAGNVAWIRGKELSDDNLLSKARDLFGRAAKCSRSISWFAELTCEVKSNKEFSAIDVDTTRACEHIYERLSKIGFIGKQFNKEMDEFANLIFNNESNPFERGLEIVGKSLGLESIRPNVEGAPDNVWCFSDHVAFAFEAKSDETPDDSISLRTVREAKTHSKWVYDNCKISSDAEVTTIIITPRKTINKEAQRNANELYYIHVDDIRKLAKDLVSSLRRIRSKATELDQVKTIGIIYDELNSINLLPAKLLTTLKKTPLKTLSVK